MPSLFVVFGTSLDVVALLGPVVASLFFVSGRLDFTLEIALPPLSKPPWFNFTVFSGVPAVVSAGFVIVIPVGVIFTVLLLASLNSALVNPLNTCFKE